MSAGIDYEMLWGRPFLIEHLAGIQLKISLNAFFQTNTLMAHALYGLVAREVFSSDLQPGRDGTGSRGAAGGPVIWDLYSGVGSIGLSLASRAGKILGIEAIAEAVEDARENARLNGIENARFLGGDARAVLREIAQGKRTLPEDVAKPDVVVLDPPRAGLHRRVIDRIGELGVPRIVYVSCNPATLAPNAAQLQEYGYRLERVTPVDMFPHTPHVEAVALMSRCNP